MSLNRTHLLKSPDSVVRAPLGFCYAIAIAWAVVTLGVNTCQSKSFPQSDSISCVVYPAVPDGLKGSSTKVCRALKENQNITLENGFVSVQISALTGLIVYVENKLVGERYPIHGDQIGFAYTKDTGETLGWVSGNGIARKFKVQLDNSEKECRVALTSRTPPDAAVITVIYSLKRDQFWIERRFNIESGKAKYDHVIYGRAEIPKGKVNELKLGKFDSPRLVSTTNGGIFCGVGWWFYSVKDGVYQNTRMDCQTDGHFETEPWYLGVFQPEKGEPYPGWFWYKTFLSERKLAYDKLGSHVLWNARSGYSFQPINNPDLLNFIKTADAIGLDGITAGEVRGLSKGTKLAATDLNTRKIIDTFARYGVTFGLHEGDVNARHWRTDSGLETKLGEIDAAAKQGIHNLTIDFFSVADLYSNHRRVTEYFRHVRDKMSYTECHLGMAVYGPQFQREVLINHPTDLHDFDISRFSSDWATLLGFRKSRREWQERYQYLMPENGLFYFCTHYSNYPRRYEEPEKQQFLYIADAWRGLAYAFHDAIGFRDAVAAQAAFSTFYVFGFLDARIPKADAKFARDYLKWVKANAEVLNRSRVCVENEDALVMSKIQNGRGAVFAINYKPGKKRFAVKLEIGGKPADIRQIYPTREKRFQLEPDKNLEIEVPGERLAILEVNEGLKGLPPENPSAFSIDVTNWEQAENGFEASFALPDVRATLPRMKNPMLPIRIASADQVETEFVTTKPAGKSLGKLPREFLDAYGFEEDRYLPAWKVVPWAFADRIWFVYVPALPPKLSDEMPELKVNGKAVPMAPRVRYNPRTKLAHPENWDVPMLFADVTEVCRYGATNHLALTRIKGEKPSCFVTGASQSGAE